MHCKIRVPSRIKIGGFDYKIKQSERISKELDSDGNWGKHIGALREIHLASDANISPQEYSQTFLHEIIHAVNSIYCESKKLEETEVAAISHGLFQALEQLGVRFIK